ncbi:hypothetical protein HYX58_00505 [Candidatus Dependentiae bacterium]|nr:hypothetical protein [Candidatus Dependentiae bacterium]
MKLKKSLCFLASCVIMFNARIHSMDLEKQREIILNKITENPDAKEKLRNYLTSGFTCAFNIKTELSNDGKLKLKGTQEKILWDIAQEEDLAPIESLLKKTRESD